MWQSKKRLKLSSELKLCLLNYVIFQVICFTKTLMIHVNGKFDESHLVSLTASTNIYKQRVMKYL